jgi:hypothetical protein
MVNLVIRDSLLYETFLSQYYSTTQDRSELSSLSSHPWDSARVFSQLIEFGTTTMTHRSEHVYLHTFFEFIPVPGGSSI